MGPRSDLDSLEKICVLFPPAIVSGFVGYTARSIFFPVLRKFLQYCIREQSRVGSQYRRLRRRKSKELLVV
jgi:hypothetical protein